MEADWEVEIGPGAPVIDASWPGFVDLRRAPQSAPSLPETRAFPPLALSLIHLNHPKSPVWTAKCDLWSMHPGDFDPYELESTPETAIEAWACYIDLLPRSDQQWTVPAMAVSSCKSLCSQLHAVPLNNCRADLIVRAAIIAPAILDHGITAYLTACGPTELSAKQALQAALRAFTHAVSPNSAIE